MSIHAATVRWTLKGDDFTAGCYSRAHLLEFEGVSVPGTASPSVVPAPWSVSRAVDPEAAFVASLSACHMLWFLDIAAQDGWVVQSYEDAAEGLLARDGEGRMAMTRVTLRPAARFGSSTPDQAMLASLHDRAHAACFIARSVRTEVRVEPGAAAESHPA